MRWLPLLSVIISLSIAGGRLLSQETPATGLDGPPELRPGSLLRESTAVHFQLVLGRIQLDRVRYRKGTHSRQPRLPGDDRTLTESLSIDAVGGIPSVRYSRQWAGRALTLDVNDRGTLQLESTDPSGRSRAVVTQQSGRPISVRHFDGDHCEEYSVATWIHLSVADASLYRQHCEPLVDDLLYPIRLSELARQAHDRTIADIVGIQSVESGVSLPSDLAQPWIDNQTLGQWIAGLGSTGRAERIEALRRLHGQGISLLPRLQQLDRGSLDAEQRDRLAQLIQQLTPRTEDDAARVAALIRDDPSYWTAAADQLSGHEQRLVAARFQSLADPVRVRAATTPPAEGIRRR